MPRNGIWEIHSGPQNVWDLSAFRDAQRLVTKARDESSWRERHPTDLVQPLALTMVSLTRRPMLPVCRILDIRPGIVPIQTLHHPLQPYGRPRRSTAGFLVLQ